VSAMRTGTFGAGERGADTFGAGEQGADTDTFGAGEPGDPADCAVAGRGFDRRRTSRGRGGAAERPYS
jgi:hypothetical protein